MSNFSNLTFALINTGNQDAVSTIDYFQFAGDCHVVVGFSFYIDASAIGQEEGRVAFEVPGACLAGPIAFLDVRIAPASGPLAIWTSDFPIILAQLFNLVTTGSGDHPRFLIDLETAPGMTTIILIGRRNSAALAGVAVRSVANDTQEICQFPQKISELSIP